MHWSVPFEIGEVCYRTLVKQPLYHFKIPVTSRKNLRSVATVILDIHIILIESVTYCVCYNLGKLPELTIRFSLLFLQALIRVVCLMKRLFLETLTSSGHGRVC